MSIVALMLKRAAGNSSPIGRPCGTGEWLRRRLGNPTRNSIEK